MPVPLTKPALCAIAGLGPRRSVARRGVVLGLVRARRGDPDVWTPLDQALVLAEPIGELQRVATVACARAEARWLVGQIEAIVAETDSALTLALERGDRWATGDLLVWRSRAGVTDAVSDEQILEPIRLELRRERDAAAAAWYAIGCPYEAALALASGDDPAQLRQGLAELQRVGAHAAARRVARTLREHGVRDVRMGPRRAARANPASLTPRELEVLALLAEGRRNADIAAQLFVSERTVAHHVSAILRKLGARTRGEAASKATALGIAGR
jgi:DNA-binding CsgD family transcriptional regulator